MMTIDDEITWGERAAIMEYLGRLPREEAERLAKKISEGRADEAEQLTLTNVIPSDDKRRLQDILGRW